MLAHNTTSSTKHPPPHNTRHGITITTPTSNSIIWLAQHQHPLLPTPRNTIVICPIIEEQVETQLWFYVVEEWGADGYDLFSGIGCFTYELCQGGVCGGKGGAASPTVVGTWVYCCVCGWVCVDMCVCIGVYGVVFFFKFTCL